MAREAKQARDASTYQQRRDASLQRTQQALRDEYQLQQGVQRLQQEIQGLERQATHLQEQSGAVPDDLTAALGSQRRQLGDLQGKHAAALDEVRQAQEELQQIGEEPMNRQAGGAA